MVDEPTDTLQERFSSRVRREFRDGRPVYHKRYIAGGFDATPEIIRARASRERELIAHLATSRLFKGPLGVPTIVATDPVAATVVTEEIPGRPLEESLAGRRRERASSSSTRAVCLVGNWLRQFQQLSVCDQPKQRVSLYDATDLVEYCRLRIGTVRELGYDWPGTDDERRILATLRNLVSRSGDDDRRSVWSHGDFGPGNILWDGKVVTPIDFAMAHPDVPLADVTYFVHRLEMLAIYFPWRRWPLGAWKKALLSGYGRPGAEDSPMYRALMARHFFCRLQTYVRRPPANLKQRLHRKWILRRVRQELTRLATCKQ